MNKDQIVQIAAEAGVKAAIDYMEKQKQKESKARRDKRLHNTKLLMKNYNIFKKHCENSIYKIQQVVEDESADEILEALENFDGNAVIETIKKSVTKTYIILAHIDKMLKMYDIYCQQSTKDEDRRRNRIIKSYYLDDVKMSVIAKNETIDERTGYRDINDGCKVLGALIFGIECLTEMS